MSPELSRSMNYLEGVNLRDHISELLAVLLDPSADWSDRHDAAIAFRRASDGQPFNFDRNWIDEVELGEIPAEWLDPRVVEALATVVSSGDEVLAVAAEAAEALAGIWSLAGAVDEAQFNRLPPDRRVWVWNELGPNPQRLFSQT